MIKRATEDRRANGKGRNTIGRRKEEKYSMFAYRAVIVIMLSVVATHISLVLVNLK